MTNLRSFTAEARRLETARLANRSHARMIWAGLAVVFILQMIARFAR